MEQRNDAWFARRTSRWQDWPVERLLAAKQQLGVTISVELATLMDTVCHHGLDAVAQVDLGSRAHRHQANHDLALMAAELLLVAERRRRGGTGVPAGTSLQQFVRDSAGQAVRVSRPVPVTERPPAATVRAT
jgi:glucosyl-3-phosphoglycerate synthase